jgi:hypothetical protein
LFCTFLNDSETAGSIDGGFVWAEQGSATLSDYLKTLKSFRINSDVSKDEIVDSNMKVQKSASNEIFVHLPDRLFAHMKSDEQDLQFIYEVRR